MSTLVYNHKDKHIALDSRITKGSMIINDWAEKYIVGDKICAFFVGSSADYRDMFEVINTCSNGDSCRELDCTGYFVKDKKVYSIETIEGRVFINELTCSESLGSGSAYALAALDIGLNAKDAVKVACKRDTYSGGLIRVFDVVHGVFI